MRIFKSHPLLSLVNGYLVDSPQPSNLSYLWNFGSLLAFCLVIQIITGVTLAMHYNPSVLEAFNSVEHIMRDVNNGWLIRYLHSNTASAFFFLVYLHIGRGLYYGSFKDLITIFLFIVVLSVFVFFMPNVLGDSENYVMANPMQTPPAIVPEWYLLPFYAILRSIPNKLLGVIAMFSAILILLIMPFTDLGAIILKILVMELQQCLNQTINIMNKFTFVYCCRLLLRSLIIRLAIATLAYVLISNNLLDADALYMLLVSLFFVFYLYKVVTRNRSVTLFEFIIGIALSLTFLSLFWLVFAVVPFIDLNDFLIYLNETSDGGSNGSDGQDPQEGSDGGSRSGDVPDQHSPNAGDLCTHDRYDPYTSLDEESVANTQCMLNPTRLEDGTFQTHDAFVGGLSPVVCRNCHFVICRDCSSPNYDSDVSLCSSPNVSNHDDSDSDTNWP